MTIHQLVVQQSSSLTGILSALQHRTVHAFPARGQGNERCRRHAALPMSLVGLAVCLPLICAHYPHAYSGLACPEDTLIPGIANFHNLPIGYLYELPYL